MRAEIITVGSELLYGRTIDTHSSYLSKECFKYGIEALYHTSVGDNHERLFQTISLASSRSNLIFLCGGLGPTIDDLTKETLAHYLEIDLVQDKETLKRLQNIYSNQSSFPSSNIKQTYVFPSGAVFTNHYGTAPGLTVAKNNVIYILLPGPPFELVPMFEDYVRPFLKENCTNQSMYTEILSFFGIGESYLEERLHDVMASNPNLTIAPYVKEGELTLSLTAKTNSIEEAKYDVQVVSEEVLNRVGEYCFSKKEETLEEAVVSILREQKKSIAAAESCTGGLMAHLVSTVPGSSGELKGGWVCYTNEIKNKVVGVPKEMLQIYGAVSVQTAESLAREALESFESSYALSITGVAGPTALDNYPVGSVYIGFAEVNQPTKVYQFSFSGSRKRIQLLSAKYALFILLQRLKKGERIK